MFLKLILILIILNLSACDDQENSLSNEKNGDISSETEETTTPHSIAKTLILNGIEEPVSLKKFFKPKNKSYN